MLTALESIWLEVALVFWMIVLPATVVRGVLIDDWLNNRGDAVGPGIYYVIAAVFGGIVWPIAIPTMIAVPLALAYKRRRSPLAMSTEEVEAAMYAEQSRREVERICSQEEREE